MGKPLHFDIHVFCFTLHAAASRADSVLRQELLEKVSTHSDGYPEGSATLLNMLLCIRMNLPPVCLCLLHAIVASGCSVVLRLVLPVREPLCKHLLTKPLLASNALPLALGLPRAVLANAVGTMCPCVFREILLTFLHFASRALHKPWPHAGLANSLVWMSPR